MVANHTFRISPLLLSEDAIIHDTERGPARTDFSSPELLGGVSLPVCLEPDVGDFAIPARPAKSRPVAVCSDQGLLGLAFCGLGGRLCLAQPPLFISELPTPAKDR